MSGDDQHFLDVLSHIPNDVKRYSADITLSIDRGFDHAALYLRQTISPWLPESIRPPPPRPPPVAFIAPAVGASGYLAHAQNWISENRAVTAATVAFLATGGFIYYRQRRLYSKKRRAKRNSNGSRREVVVVSGAPNLPITRSLILDLERRGFIVYVVVDSASEEQMVRGEGKMDIIPLHMNIVDHFDVQSAIHNFGILLNSPHAGHGLVFTGFILVPDTTYPAGPVETIAPDMFSDAINTKVLNTILIAQAFLPTVCDHKARVLMLTPNTISSLRPPFHAVESTVVSALEGFAASLGAELNSLGVDLCQMKLGTFDRGSLGAGQHLQRTEQAEVAGWSTHARNAYARNYNAHGQELKDMSVLTRKTKGSKGSPLRELHNAVFDALTQSKPRRIWRVGRGSLLHEAVGSWVPPGIVGWMMGMQRVTLERPGDRGETDWEEVER